jgi:hypothetical protein
MIAVAFVLGVALTAGWTQNAAVVPDPLVEGPIAATAAPGSGAHEYPFLATDRDFKGIGYIEQEFFISGTANRYETPAGRTGTILSSGHPYKTRMVVRRPADPAKFNGVAVLEWINVTGGRDYEVDWFQTATHLTEAGYAYVALSAQDVGVKALKQWSSRYSSLDVTANGTITGDALSYDIFSQATQALRNPTGTPPLGNLKATFVLAIGESQSAARLASYINSIHPLHNVVNAFILHSSGSTIRTDLTVPVWKILTETDVVSQFASRQPDTDRFRTWEVPGTSHSDWQMYLGMASHLLDRDLGPQPPDAACTNPNRSRVPVQYVLSMAIDDIVRWAKDGVAPPIAPRIALTETAPPQIVRDANGNALGGIRLAELDAPTARTTGQNTGPSFCTLRGTHVPFSDSVLASLYPSHGAYVAKVTQVTRAAVAAGYILRADGEATIEAAKRSIVGKGLACGELCQNVGPDMTSISKLRDETAVLAYDRRQGSPLVHTLESALEQVALGDAAASNHRPTASRFYEQSVQDLTEYTRDVADLKKKGVVQDWTADWLMKSVEILKGRVAALAAPR